MVEPLRVPPTPRPPRPLRLREQTAARFGRRFPSPRCSRIPQPPSRHADLLLVVDLESLVRMKQTQRAKDYAVIGELTRLLPRHISRSPTPRIRTGFWRWPRLSPHSRRGPAVLEAAGGRDRAAVIAALAAEMDELAAARSPTCRQLPSGCGSALPGSLALGHLRRHAPLADAHASRPRAPSPNARFRRRRPVLESSHADAER